MVDRPIQEVFDFLAAGVNDPQFSPRVLEIVQKTSGPPGVGTVFESTVKDAGMTSHREFELTEFDPPRHIRWAERSSNNITAIEGGYDLEPSGDGTKVTVFNVLEGHGLGRILEPIAVRVARKDAPAFALRIKSAIEG